MSSSTLTRRTFLYQFIWVVFVVLTLGLTAFFLTRQIVVDTHVEHTAETVGAVAAAAEVAADAEAPAVRDFAQRLSDALDARRVTVFDGTGNVLADVGALSEDPQRFGLPGEYFRAVRRGVGWATRHETAGAPAVTHVARRVDGAGDVPALVVRVSHLRRTVLAPLGRSFVIVAYIAAALLAASALYVWSFVSRYAGSLDAILEATDAYARGDLRHRAAVELPDATLLRIARNMNEMAYRLSHRVTELVAERDELATILSNMVEGVILTDGRAHVRSVNEAARRIFSTGDRDAEGRSLVEFTRNAEVDEFARAVMTAGRPLERTIAVYDQEMLYLQLHGSALRDAQGEPAGTVLVVSDVSRLKRLENIRKDFVANVSHELKTPITSILGFVETLKDGGVTEPARAERFLDIIAGHGHRLNLIIDDLLSLSRLESQEQEVERDWSDLESVIEAVTAACEAQARQKSITVSRQCDCDGRAYINASLLQQAVTNLVDNAVKYSPAGASVGIHVTGEKDDLLISVHDTGPGIPKRDQPRVFERFYRVDRARSRALGGTGLGLSIVKHIAQGHGGLVEVESVVGEGSTFTIRIPRKPD